MSTKPTKARTVEAFDAAGTFDAKKYVNAIWTCFDGPYYSVCHPYTMTRPLTLDEHEAAEAEAHEQMDARLSNGPDSGTPSLEDTAGDAEVSVQDVESFADNVLLDMRVWERVANDLLAFRRGGSFIVKGMRKPIRRADGKKITHQVIEHWSEGKESLEHVSTYGNHTECLAHVHRMRALVASNVVTIKKAA